jgi:hypothetical protein
VGNAETGSKFGVTKTSASIYLQAYEELRANAEQLTAMTREYPVECIFGTYRVVFETGEDVQKLIVDLGLELSRWAQ